MGSGRCGITAKQALLSESLADDRKKTGFASSGRAPAELVWSGKPDETHFPADKTLINWPKGWVKKVYKRATGDSKGATDRYWFSPVKHYKFRSLKEISRFFACMKACADDETNAWRMFKKKS